MSKLSLPSVLFFMLISVGLSGCDLIEGIFEAGFWTAIILLLVVVVLIIWLVRKFMG